MSQNIATYNPLPEQTANSDIVALRVFRDEYQSGRAVDSLTGKRQIGLVDPADASCELTPELDPVMSGAVNVSLEQLVTGWNGTCQLGLQDINQFAEEMANGTTTKVEDTFPVAPVKLTMSATGNTELAIAVADASTFSTYIGSPILIETKDGVTPMRNYIKKIDTTLTPHLIYTVYPMDEIPKASGDVQILLGFEHDLGGNVMNVHEVIMAHDFGKGAKYRNKIHKCRSTGGLKQTVAKGKVKTSMTLAIEGHSKVSGGRLQVIPITRYGTYGKAF